MQQKKPDQSRVQLEMARARWAMEARAGRGAKFNITHTRYRCMLTGQLRHGFNVFGVDTTRDARDPDAGEPVLLNDYPLESEEAAQEFAKDALVGRKRFYFRGSSIPILDPYEKRPIKS